MCLLAIAHRVSDRYPLVVAANRDERHDRPSLAIYWWHDHEIFGGRDLVGSGSWLAVDRRGRLAAVTNVREPGAPPAPRSRGKLVADYLVGAEGAAGFAEALAPSGGQYGPFNLVLFDLRDLVYTSNLAPTEILPPGIHAVSNATLRSDWPKLATAREGLRAALERDDPTDALFELLATRDPNGHESSVFVEGPEYGTRSSAVILLDAGGRLSFTERRFGPNGVPNGESYHSFEIAA
ncbi:MAG TPA: NRDE family protein [Gammaproteobacteria bacterium]